MIAIVDYGLGNIAAFLNVYRRLGIPARTASTPAELQDAERIILPGVGHFDHAMARLDASGMRDALEARVHKEQIPVLGICVGMQMLADGSEEGSAAGLGWIPGRVRSFVSWKADAPPAIPHMGWNDVQPRVAADGGLFTQLESDAKFYFLHSYLFTCADSADVLAEAEYGAPFACAVRRGNVYGVQFHPEKSHHFGTQLLRNFAAL